MCFLFSFMPATFWVTVGFFVLYSSTKADGAVGKFGRILAVWIFILAAAILICGAYLTLSGDCPIDQFLEQMKTPSGS